MLFYFFEGLLDFIVVRFSCWYVGAPNVTNYSVFVYYEDGSFGNCVAFEFCEIVAFYAVIEVKKMTEIQKKATVKAIAKSEIAAKPIKTALAKHVPAKVPAKRIPAKQVPAVHVLTTFDDLMEDFRKNFIESIAFPFEWISVEPIAPVREATVDLVEITKVFEQSKKYFDKKTLELFKDGQTPFDFPGLKLVESVEGSKAINLIKGSTIIMAGSGMITGGRIKHHLVREITRPESTLIFAGYQAVGTLGRQILDGVSPVSILGESYPVRMRIENINGLSAHAGMNDLHRWLNNFKAPPKHVFLTHGEEGAILSLENYLHSKGGWEVTAPVYLEEYDL